MRKYLLLLLLLHVLPAALFAQTTGSYWQQQVDYTIHISLNDTTKTAEGFEVITYHNHSPDSLPFIWMHVWPNAYKNDKTAFSEQKLTAGEHEFYFADQDERGYINRLDFKVDNVSLLTEDHPQYIDIIKLYLPELLSPGDSIVIQTPFHLKLPYRFSRLGYVDEHYSFTQWYPKAAVYDKDGWHPMPYLEWGEYYNDFGNYEVNITLPSNYVVAATGVLQNEDEINWMKNLDKPFIPAKPVTQKKELFVKQKPQATEIPSSKQLKTLQYKAEMVTDFAWFADKRFFVKHDTIQFSNHTIDAWNFVLPDKAIKWNNSMVFTKNAVRFYSDALGDYPYPQVSIVCDPLPVLSGMEYPMISILNYGKEPQLEFDATIAHEIGHNWLQAIIATNERQHAWMDEGMDTYLENKYKNQYYPSLKEPGGFIAKKFPRDPLGALLDAGISSHTDQPIETGSAAFTYNNYEAAVYAKAGRWMKKLAAEIGPEKMQELMHAYYREWKFKHPQPVDFKHQAETVAGRKLDLTFDLLHKTGPITTQEKLPLKITGLFNFNKTNAYRYIGIAPAIGFNNYDKAEIGLLIHNYNLPARPFKFIATPLFGTGSKQLVGYARAEYNFYPKGKIYHTEIYASAARFNIDNGHDLAGEKIFKSFNKITPGIYLELKKKAPVGSLRKWMDIKTWIINEQQLQQRLRPAPADTVYYDYRGKSKTRVIPQITFGLTNDRSLYPWDVALNIQQVKQLVRTTLTANYFLNYNEHRQGISARLFFGKIFYTTAKTNLIRAQNSHYHFTMYGPNGYQDYTYSNAFAERNQSTSLLGRQIMIRDGGFKYRSDFSSVQPGLKLNGIDFFDNWLAAANFKIDIPNKLNPLSVLPVKVPLRIFADIGTSASPWEANSELPRFLYSAGLELPLFKVITVYYPFVQSKAFKEPNSVNDPTRAGGPTWWQKRLTFSVDIMPLRKKIEGWGIL